LLFGMFVNSKSLNWIYTLGIVLFAAFIAIDTNFILQDNYQKNHTPIEASLKYYLDILNLYNFVKGKKSKRLR
jgi:FtsH-binding integral membrane protein